MTRVPAWVTDRGAGRDLQSHYGAPGFGVGRLGYRPERLYGSGGVLSRTIAFESIPKSPDGTYFFCEDNESFKVPESLMESPWSLFSVSLRNNMSLFNPGYVSALSQD